MSRYPLFCLLIPLVATIWVLHIVCPDWLPATPPASCPAAMALRQRMVNRYREAGLSGPELGTVAALTLGDKSELDPTTRLAFRDAGAMHLLAVSGLHTGIFLSIVWALLTCFGWRRPLYDQTLRRWLLAGVTIVVLWGYAILTGMSPSVVRSVIMASLGLIGYACHRPLLSINALAGAALLILVVRPQDLFSISFQLSFAAVTALVLLVPVLSSLVRLPHTWPYGVRRVVRYGLDLVWVSLAAQIGTAPFTLYYFGSFSTYFLLTNIVVVPAAFVIMVLGLATLALGTVPWVGVALGWMLSRVTWLLNTYVTWVEHLPCATVSLPLSAPMACCLVLAMGCGWLAIRPVRVSVAHGKAAWHQLFWLCPCAVLLALFVVLYLLCESAK